MKYSILILILLILGNFGFSQVRYMVNGEIREIDVDAYKAKGYIVSDTVTTQGYIIKGIKGENSRICKFKRFVKDTVRVFTPEEIDAWGIYEEVDYKTCDLVGVDGKMQKVFLKILSKGKANVLCLENLKGNTYYLEDNDGNLIKLNSSSKENLQKDVLLNFPDMSNSDLKLINLKDDKVKLVFDKYNSNSDRALLYSKFGIVGGIGMSNLNTMYNAIGIWNMADFETQVTPEFGVFLDLHLFKNLPKLTLHPELIYSKYSYEYNALVPIMGQMVDQTLDIDITMFKIPLIIRYNSLSPKLAVFGDVGILITYCRNDIKILSDVDPNMYMGAPPVQDESRVFDNGLAGVVFGGGLKYPLDYKRMLYIGSHYEWMMGITDRRRPAFSNIVIKAGISF